MTFACFFLQDCYVKMSGIKHKSTNLRMSPIKQYVIVLGDRSEVTERKKEKKKEQNNEQKKEKLTGEMKENNSIYFLHFGKDMMLELLD